MLYARSTHQAQPSVSKQASHELWEKQLVPMVEKATLFYHISLEPINLPCPETTSCNKKRNKINFNQKFDILC